MVFSILQSFLAKGRNPWGFVSILLKCKGIPNQQVSYAVSQSKLVVSNVTASVCRNTTTLFAAGKKKDRKECTMK
jgi:hypothetical protein